MATDENETGPNLDRLNENLLKIEALSQRLIAAMAKRKPVDPSLEGPSQDLYMKAAAAYMAEMMGNPAKVIETQVGYWGKTLKHYMAAQQALAEGAAPEDPTPADRRFANEMWQTNPWFNFIKQQYLISAESVSDTIRNLDSLTDRERKRVDFFASQIVDLMSPTNFLATNPDALAKAMETEGQSLVDGLENLVRDIEANDGDLVVTLSDKDAFKVGSNIGVSPGKVVFRNRMLELIQYAPSTETVHERPLIIFPPWINKFYILDLKPQNSLIKWIVDQGFTLFVVSWVNPDTSYADVGMDQYISEGYHEAIRVVREITGQETVNAVGYCIAGTTLSLTMAHMARTGDVPINSATLFTTLTDFSDQGEVGVFLDDDFVDGIEKEALDSKVLRSYFMSRTFSYLRSNDLIYQPAIKSYMLGEAPPAFDLLFWNGDSTNLPSRMAIEYLRGLCQADQFSRQGFPVLGEMVSIRDVSVPICAIACETDHIAAWRSSFNGVVQMGSTDKTFILSESGHIAGIVNPPSKRKYGHYINPDLDLDPEAWLEGAEYTKASWWPRWGEWLAARSGAMIPALTPGKGPYPALCDAPGTYVVANPNA